MGKKREHNTYRQLKKQYPDYLAAVQALLEGNSESGSVDAHAIQPFYAGLLARSCGLKVALEVEGGLGGCHRTTCRPAVAESDTASAGLVACWSSR